MEENLSRGRKRCVVFDTVLEKKKRIPYHQFVWISNNGDIPEGYHIHHIDGDKLNNDISNLVCIAPGEHSKIHNKERWDDEAKQKWSEAMKERWKDPEYKKRVSENNKGKGHDAEWRRKMSERQTGKEKSKETKESISIKLKERWQDPEYRAYMIDRRKGKNKGKKRTEEQSKNIAEGRSKHIVVIKETGERFYGFNSLYKSKGRSKDYVLKHPEQFEIIEK